MTYLHDDGTLILARWADHLAQGPEHSDLRVALGHRDHQMYGTSATGQPLVSNGYLGADLIAVPPGGGFAPHTHPGDHLLVVVGGYGTITVEGRIYPTEAGQIYMVEGAVPHAVSARPDSPHVILAIGAPHREIGAADRAALTEYTAVAADLGALQCLVCVGSPSGTPDELRATGCRHVPLDLGHGKPLLVGLAPYKDDPTRPAFIGTMGGHRLEQYLRLEQGHLLDAVDTVNLSPDPVDDWSRVSVVTWQALADQYVVPHVWGRVVLLAGDTVTDAVARTPIPEDRAAVMHLPDPAQSWLAIRIPHPRSMSTEITASAETQATLEVAVQMARTGPADRRGWTDRDADAINGAITRITGEYLREA